ncbi:MAG: GNAT family protein [Myxococcota bacterium]|nr:GNAT family protein [Myxococcota bacterium]
MSDFDVFITGDKVNLVALNEKVILSTPWYQWFNDERVTESMQKHYFPNSKAEQLEFYERHIKGNKHKLQLGIVTKNDGSMVGIISLDAINYINSSAAVAICIGEEIPSRLKIFVEANYLIMKHGFESLNLFRISGGTFNRQIFDLNCKMLGFVDEGISRKAVFKGGSYHDVYRFGLLRDEFQGGLKLQMEKRQQPLG